MVLKRNQSFNSHVEINVTSADRDVLLLRGSPEDASSQLLQGTVSVSVADPSSVKKVTLKLVGTMKLKWIDHINTSRGMISKPIKYEKPFYEHDFGNLLNGNGVSNRSSPSDSPVGSRSTSVTNLAALSSSSSSSHHQRSHSGLHHHQPGTPLEVPFELVIPGDTPESVEGMEHGSIVYRLHAVVERGRFSNNLSTRKLIRIVRTIGSDSFDLTQTMSIDNRWPSKVEYSIETPTKAVAIGSHCRVNFLLVPLLKGLKLGTVKTQLAEFVTLATPSGSIYNGETVVLEAKRKIRLEETQSTEDQWRFSVDVEIPSSLTKCTQDCHIGASIKVSHKLKFGISLINPDGHTSELRASLPLYLFISPSVNVSSADPMAVSYPGHQPEENLLFNNPTPPATDNPADDDSEFQGIDINAPPTYSDHIYDRLWNEIPTSAAASPNHSGESSPHYTSSRRSSGELNNESTSPLGMASLDHYQRSQLTAGLRALENYQNRAATNGGTHSTGGSGVNTPGSSGANDYFSRAVRSGQSSPLDTPEIDVQVLSRVPSYSTAVDQNGGAVPNGDFAPDYNAPSLQGSPNGRRPSLSHIHTNMSTSLPGSSANLHNMGATLNSLTPLSGSQPNGRSSSRNSMSSSREASSTNLRAHNRNYSSSALSSLLHRNASSKSLFEGLLKRSNN